MGSIVFECVIRRHNMADITILYSITDGIVKFASTDFECPTQRFFSWLYAEMTGANFSSLSIFKKDEYKNVGYDEQSKILKGGL